MEGEGEEPGGHGGGGAGGPPLRNLCCRELSLLEFPDRYVIRSVDPDGPDHAFSIGRSDGLVEPLFEDLSSLTPSRVSTIYGVLGIIRLIAGTYVLLITSRKEVGTHLNSSVFHVTSMRFLSCNGALKHSTSQEKRDEAYFMSLLRTIESTPGLYYSYERDLTLNLQRTCKLTEERMHKPLWKQADPRFIWNHSLMEELIENKLDAFTIPAIQGSFQSVQFTLKDSPARITLISRRCNRRLGTRMWRRGANLEGSTANFIETEQILEFEGYKSSFLQIRGSIPLLWEQIVDLSYKPRLNIINHDETVVERHFRDVMQRYGETIAIDLTDIITSSVLDLTIVGLDILDSDSPSEVQQPRYLKTCFNPNIDLGNVVYLLGHTDKKELAVGEGKVVIATDNLIKLFIDGVAWCPGSAGFDVHGNLAFMVCDPMKLASSPTGRSASSSSSLSWKKDTSMQFGIPIPVICDWLHQHWEGSLDEVSKPKLSKIRSMPTGQKSGNSCASFTLRRVFKAFEEVNDNILSSSPVNRRSKFQLGSSCSANSNAMFSHDENMAIDLSCTHEQGIPTPEIFESPKLISGPLQKKQYAPIQLLDINFPPRAPRSIILPPPLKQVLSDEDNVRGSEPGNVLREYDLSPKDVPQASREGKYKLPPIGTWQEDRCSVQSSSSPLEISELQHEGNEFGSEEDTMYSAETMESRNIPTPKETNLQQVGRSQSCVNYSRWTSTRRMLTAQRSASQKQRALTPACKTQSQTSALPQRSHDFHSSTVSSNMKRNSLENPRRPRRSTVQKPQRWMF